MEEIFLSVPHILSYVPSSSPENSQSGGYSRFGRRARELHTFGPCIWSDSA